jgi:hypothetical protein
MKRELQSVDDLPLFAWAAGQEAKRKRVSAAAPKNTSKPIGIVITVKDHDRFEIRKVIGGGAGMLHPTGDSIAVTDDIRLALIELLAGRGARR